MLPEVIGSIARTILVTVGGGLINQGLITEADIDKISGAVIVVLTLAWSIWQKKKAKSKQP